MSCLKYSLLIFFIFNTSFAAKFDSAQCMSAQFETEIKNSGEFFGLVKNELIIKKNVCEIEVKFLKIKWLSDKIWKIDICRKPIHVKVVDKGSESFYKRIDDCSSKPEDSFCVYWKELKTNLEDYGLIYAEGERENISTPHGQTFCTYLLLGKYLEEGILFSKYEKTPHLFSKQEVQEKTPEPAPMTDSLLEEAKSSVMPKEIDVENPAADKESTEVEEANEEKPRF